jgi:uncharacterized protein
MRLLIDIGHPGHVHLFRPMAQQLIEKGHKVLFTCRQKEFEIELLEAAGLEYVSFGKHFRTKTGKIYGLAKFNMKMFQTALKFKPDLFLSHGSLYAAQIAWLMQKPHVSMEDSGNWEQMRLYLPFTRHVLTPHELKEDLGPKQIRYLGYHELAYLHPAVFTPDGNIRQLLGLAGGEPFALLRFVSWSATHDIGQGGLTRDTKLELVRVLEEKMKVFISAEGTLPEDLVKYQIRIPPEKMHDVLSQATLFVGEGATMASESGVLGTPAIYVNSLERCYNEDQEKYGTVYNFRDSRGVIEKVKSLTADPGLKEKTLKGRERMLREKINVTRFLVWFMEHYPESADIMLKEPDHQLKFRN